MKPVMGRGEPNPIGSPLILQPVAVGKGVVSKQRCGLRRLALRHSLSHQNRNRSWGRVSILVRTFSRDAKDGKFPKLAKV